MLRAVVVANLLLAALGAGDLNYFVNKANGGSTVPCSDICSKVYGISGWSRSSSWGGGKATIKCNCGNDAAIITVECTKGDTLSDCSGSQTAGDATTPAPVAEKDASLLNPFIAKCAEDAKGRYAQVDGSVTDVKQVHIQGKFHDAQCSDLAMGCIANANKNGFNVDNGERGSEPSLPGSWAWSHDKIHYTHAKAGDIAQFHSWREKVTHSDGSWSSHRTGVKHTAVIVKDFDSSTCGLETLDQNPSEVHSTVYHPCDDKHQSGNLIVYRMTSVPLSERLYANDEREKKYSEYLKELRQEAVEDASRIPSVMIGACAAVFLVGMLGFGVWRMSRTSRRTSLLIETADHDMELSDDAGLE